MYCTPLGYIIFSLRNLKFYETRGPGAEGRIWGPGAGKPKDPFLQSKTARKRLFIVALSPSRLKISDYLLYSIVFCVSSLKGSFWNKKTQHKKQLVVLRNIWEEEFRRGASKRFSKTGKLFALTGRRGEINQNGEIFPLDRQRRQVCRIP